MKAFVAFIISHSFLFPILTGFFRFRVIRTYYLPLFWNLVLGFLTEILCFNPVHFYHASNAVPANIIVLAEWLLLSFQFRVWGLLRRHKLILVVLIILPVVVWFLENILFEKIVVFSPYFRLVYACLVTLLSITEINFCIIDHNGDLWKDPTFLICMGLILFFIYQMLYEWSYQVSILHEPSHFTRVIHASFAYIDAVTNILFGIAFLLIPAPRAFHFEL